MDFLPSLLLLWPPIYQHHRHILYRNSGQSHHRGHPGPVFVILDQHTRIDIHFFQGGDPLFHLKKNCKEQHNLMFQRWYHKFVSGTPQYSPAQTISWYPVELTCNCPLQSFIFAKWRLWNMQWYVSHFQMGGG